MLEKQNSFNTQKQQPQTSPNSNPDSERDLPPSLPRNSHPQHSFNSSVYLSGFVEERSQLLIPLLGYGLLLLALFDYIYILIYPQFTNPVWEFQTIGKLVEHTVAPLLGLMLVFYRREGYINNLEKKVLGLLSWVALLIGILYLLMMPLAIVDTWRIYDYNNVQIAAQLSQQNQPVQQIKDRLARAKTDVEIQNLLASLASGNGSAPPKIDSPQKLKVQLLAQLSESERNMQDQANKAQTSQRQTLLKNCVKWNLGALVAGTLFIWIWCLTNWVRISQD